MCHKEKANRTTKEGTGKKEDNRRGKHVQRENLKNNPGCRENRAWRTGRGLKGEVGE